MQEIIDEPSNLDVWVVYQPEEDVEYCQSLHKALWNISFDPDQDVKNYEVQHAKFFELLAEKDGKRHLANLMKTTCELLRKIEDIGAMYANLRPENIILMFNEHQN